MAVPEQTPYQEYTANGVATSFAVAFQCLSKDTLIVTINGVEQSPTLWNLTGGNVVFVAAPANLAIVGIERSTALTREVTYQTYDNSFRPSVLNGDIDRLWHVLQENQLIYDKKVDKAAQIQTLGNLQGGGAIGLGLTLSLKDQTVTADYQFGSSIKIPVITLNQDGTVKSLHEVDMIGGGGGAFQIGWGDVLNKPTTLNGYGIIDAYAKSETHSKTETYTKSEVNTAINNAKPVDATTTQKGIIQVATNAEVQAGTNTVKAITPSALQYKLNFKYSNVAGSRLFSTNYTNATDENLYIGVATTALYNTSLTLRATITQNSVATVVPMSAVANAASVTLCGYVVVPPRAAYKIDVCATDGTVLSGYTVGSWAEGKI